MTQEALLAGSVRRIAEVRRLAVGIVAVVIAVCIARSIRGRRQAAATA